MITIESVMEMLVLVEKYNIKDMKEALLLRMKSQVVDEKNFMGIVKQVEKLSYSSAHRRSSWHLQDCRFNL